MPGIMAQVKALCSVSGWAAGLGRRAMASESSHSTACKPVVASHMLAGSCNLLVLVLTYFVCVSPAFLLPSLLPRFFVLSVSLWFSFRPSYFLSSYLFDWLPASGTARF